MGHWQIPHSFRLMVVILIQTFLLVFLNLTFYTSVQTGFATDSILIALPKLNLIIGLFGFISLYVLVTSSRVPKMEMDYKHMQTQLEHIEELVRTLKSQRHDFLNHLQVIHGFLQINNPSGAYEYTSQLLGEIVATNAYINTGNPAISALFHTKAAVAESKGIHLDFRIQAKLQDLPVKPWEINRIFGNLINNAIEAVETLPPESRKIVIQITEEADKFTLVMSNPGKPIPPEIAEKLFLPGFSTKGNKERGYGLYIVKTLTEQNGGRVNLVCDDGQITFTVTLPKR